MKISSKYRVYLEETFNPNQELLLNEEVFHHLTKVLRLTEGSKIIVFNPECGEYSAIITKITKNQALIQITHQISKFTKDEFNLHLAFAPLKKELNSFVIEKATELGVHEITQIITEFTNCKPLDFDKCKKKAILSSQQCKRLDVPKINSPISLLDFINSTKQKIFWLNEKKMGENIATILANNHEIYDAIFLVGPEGGFSPKEFDILSNHSNVIPCFFNTNILRAETAILTALITFRVIYL